MPDKRTHRGPHPEDSKIFAAEKLSGLRRALADFSLLLTKGYSDKSALKLVGDRFALTSRQRLAVMRSACSDSSLETRLLHQIPLAHLSEKSIAVDGYNLLITIEAALSGARIFIGRDGCCRDLAGLHGTYRKVTETIPAVELIGNFLHQFSLSSVVWYLDTPVSNSGRLKNLIGQIAEKYNWPWRIELLFNPDDELIRTDLVVATTDSVILDNCQQWTNLASRIIKQKIPDAELIDMVG